MGEFQDVESEDKIMDEDEEEFFDEDEGEEVYPCEAWVSIYIKYIYNPLIRQFFFFFFESWCSCFEGSGGSVWY